MEFDETFKILLVGDSGVGKSSILLRFTDDVFEPMQPTIGVDFKVKAMRVDNRRVKMTIWDTYVSFHLSAFYPSMFQTFLTNYVIFDFKLNRSSDLVYLN